MSADEIVTQYPQLSLADIYAALAYYWDHRDAIEREMTEDDALIAAIRQAGPGPLAEKLRRLRGE